MSVHLDLNGHTRLRFALTFAMSQGIAAWSFATISLPFPLPLSLAVTFAIAVATA